MSDSIEHDGGASLRVEYLTGVPGRKEGVGWFVVRTCACHRGYPITRPYKDREHAERVLEFLDLDARNHQ